MERRLVAAFLVLVLILMLPGCSFFNKDYLSVSNYADGAGSDMGSNISQIGSYAELLTAINAIIVNHKAQGRLRFSDYSGSLQSDLEKACSEIKANSALASYAVDYMSYDISKISTFYGATVYITYKHTQKDISAIQYISGVPRLEEQLETAMNALAGSLTFSVTGDSINKQSTAKAVGDVFTADPASCVVQPGVTVNMYPEIGLSRIVEVKLEYGWKQTELKKMKSELEETLGEITGRLEADSESATALRAFHEITSVCKYDPSGQGRDKSDLNTGLGSTAYGALCEGYADSRGMALAFSAFCHTKDIDCRVVTGTLDSKAHTWNMVKLDGSWYHVDVSAASSQGTAASFMRNDTQMQTHYSWDATAYPACIGAKTYSEALAIAGQS